MNILVTGASGFLGRHLTAFLQRQGHRVVGPSSQSCNLLDPSSLDQFNHEHFDQIYHLAAWTQAGDFCLHHPGEQWILNQKINTHVLAWWQKSQPTAKLIAMGTSCSYDPAFPLQEEYYLEGQPIESLFAYGMTKRMLLCGLRALHHQFGLCYLYLVPSTLYGPGYHTDGRQLHFIFDLVRKIVRGQQYQERVVLWGDGTQERELIHVDDFIQALWTLSQKESHQVINVSAGEGHSIRSFAKEICEAVGYPCDRVEFDSTRYVGARSKVLSTTKLKTLLPHFAPRPLRVGIAEVVEWFSDQAVTQ